MLIDSALSGAAPVSPSDSASPTPTSSPLATLPPPAAPSRRSTTAVEPFADLDEDGSPAWWARVEARIPRWILWLWDRALLITWGGWVGFVGIWFVVFAQVFGLSRMDNAEDWPWVEDMVDGWGEMMGAASMTLGVLLLIAGWILLRPHFQPGGSAEGDIGTGSHLPPLSQRRLFWIVSALWLVPLLPLLGTLSADAQFYAEFGWMPLQGMNPYEEGLGEVGSPFQTDGIWEGMSAPYPALAVRVMELIVLVTGSHWYWSVVAMRLIAVAGYLALVWGLDRLATQIGITRGYALWLGVLNPIVIIHGVGGMHVDMLMVGLVAVALALGYKSFGRVPGWVAGALVIGVAAGFKPHALLGAVPLAMIALQQQQAEATAGSTPGGVGAGQTGSAGGSGAPRRGGRGPGRTTTDRLTVADGTTRRAPVILSWPRTILCCAVVVIVSAVAFVVLSYAVGLGLGWVRAASIPGAVVSPGLQTLFSIPLLIGAGALGVDVTDEDTVYFLYNISRLTFIVLSLGGFLYLFFRYIRTRPYLFLAAGALIAAYGLSSAREWYTLFWICLLPLARPGVVMRWGTALLVPFIAMTAVVTDLYTEWSVIMAVMVAAGVAIAVNAHGFIIPKAWEATEERATA
ncbi:MAG: polyprenol phosphomannose-dependent alpha 1,6 mannosyltransferase MptB [Propionibacteriaceae bacterium]|nr:polyprenol phosphomannose-dependent alpha 1,6 mannosyltransferase MptB [Propionibacteriaceae bacterium]